MGLQRQAHYVKGGGTASIINRARLHRENDANLSVTLEREAVNPNLRSQTQIMHALTLDQIRPIHDN